MNPGDADSNDRREIGLLYQLTVNEMASFKSHQWTVTNHALLLYAGLVGITQMLKAGLTAADRVVLVAGATAVCLGALTVLNKLQRSIDVREARRYGARAEMGEPFQRIWAAKQGGKEMIRAVWMLRGAIVIGWIVSAWLSGWRL